MKGFRVVATHDRQAEAFVTLRRFRGAEPRADFDLVDVRAMGDLIRTPRRYAVIRYTQPS